MQLIWVNRGFVCNTATSTSLTCGQEPLLGDIKNSRYNVRNVPTRCAADDLYFG